jgi:hypothetical protein
VTTYNVTVNYTGIEQQSMGYSSVQSVVSDAVRSLSMG